MTAVGVSTSEDTTKINAAFDIQKSAKCITMSHVSVSLLPTPVLTPILHNGNLVARTFAVASLTQNTPTHDRKLVRNNKKKSSFPFLPDFLSHDANTYFSPPLFLLCARLNSPSPHASADKTTLNLERPNRPHVKLLNKVLPSPDVSSWY